MIFVPSEEVKKLLYGSYEHLISRVDEVVQREKDKLFGEGCGVVETLGVFPGHAIVGDAEGKFLRLKFEDIRGRELRVLAQEEINVPIVTRKNVSKFVADQARQVVEDLMSGRSDAAFDRLKDVTPFVGVQEEGSDKDLTESIISGHAAERPWKRLYREQSQRIRKFLWGDLTTLEESRLTAKYKNLYDGSTPDEELEPFREEVASDLMNVAQRAGSLADAVITAHESVADVSTQLKDPEDDATLTMFGSFAEDLVEDLREINHVVSEAAKRIECVSCLGELYDNMAVSLYDYEVAGRFVERMAAKFKDAR